MDNQYLVYTCYYKHGEHGLCLVKGDESLRVQLEAYFAEHNEGERHVAVPGDGPGGLALDELVRLSLRLGRAVIEEQEGYGIVHVTRVRGEVRSYARLDRALA